MLRPREMKGTTRWNTDVRAVAGDDAIMSWGYVGKALVGHA